MALLVLPFVIVAVALTIAQSMRPGARLGELARPFAPREASPAAPGAEVARPRDIALRSPLPALPTAPPRSLLPDASIIPAPRLSLPQASAPVVEAPAVAVASPRLDTRSLAVAPDLAAEAAAVSAAAPRALGRLPDLAFSAPEIRASGADPVLARAAPPIPVDVGDVRIAAPAIGLPRAAPAIPRPELAMPAAPLPETRPAPAAAAPPGQCIAAARTSPDTGRDAATLPASRTPAGEGAGQGFGARLAAAALAQTREFVIYNDKYRRIAYPMGDVPALFGVCTDVVIRAYRAVGVDLQALVQAARVGSGDANIDHRRVETLRRFFAVAGRSLPVTDFAESYRPGDIVSYHRPQNSHSRSHIAVVADVIGPSGRPMIIHNRGWGPQLEDALFVDRITGHYRFDASGERAPAGRVAAATQASGGTISKSAALAPPSRSTAASRSALAQSGTRSR